MEGPGGEVFAGFPLGGCSGERGAVLGGMFDAETFEEGANDVGLENPRDEMRVEAFRLVGITDDEDFFLVSALDVTAGIAGNEEEKERKKGKESKHRRNSDSGEGAWAVFFVFQQRIDSSARWLLDPSASPAKPRPATFVNERLLYPPPAFGSCDYAGSDLFGFFDYARCSGRSSGEGHDGIADGF